MVSLIAAAAFQSLFALDIRVLDAVEGGPLVVEATATYRGDKPLSVWLSAGDSAFSVELPAEWPVYYHPRPQSFLYIGPKPDYYRIDSGCKWSARIPAHKLVFGDIPAGLAELHVNFCVVCEGRRPVVISRRVRVTLERFGQHAVRSVAADVERAVRAERRDHTYDDALTQQADRIVGTRHREFVPLALRLLRANGTQAMRRDLREFLHQFAEGTAGLHERDVETVLACRDPFLVREVFDDWTRYEGHADPVGWCRSAFHSTRQFARALAAPRQFARDGHAVSPREVLWAAQFWPRPERRLPDRHLARLLGAKPLWLRAYVAACFRDRLPPEWVARLESDLRARVAPLADEQIRRWVEQLNDDDFATREAASRGLLRYFERTGPHLKAAFADAPAEARSRITNILDRGGKTERDPLERDFVDWVCAYERPPARSRRLFDILAAGDPKLDVVARAREIAARK